MAWEQLHLGPWSELGPVWRDAYALACLHVASLCAGEDRRAALLALDMGLITDGGLLRAELEAAIAWVLATAPVTEMWIGGGKGSVGTDTSPMLVILAERWYVAVGLISMHQELN